MVSPRGLLFAGLALSLVASAQAQVGLNTAAAPNAAGVQALDPNESTAVSGTWTLANSPYELTQDVVVFHLIIEAGVEVLAAPGVEMLIQGELIARGAPGAPIQFRNVGAQGRWNGLRFWNAKGSSVLSNCLIEGSRSSGIEIKDSQVFLRDCTISNNATRELGGGLSAHIDNGDLVLENCSVLGNTAGLGGGGINAEIPNGQLVLDGCTVEGNSTTVISSTFGGAEGGGVRCENSMALYITGSTIRGNSILVDTNYGAVAEGGGIWVADTPLTVDLSVVESNSVVGVCDIMYCTVYSSGGGICADNSTTSMTLSVVRDNFLESRAKILSSQSYTGSLGGGIYVNNNDKTLTADNCLITGNQGKATGWTGYVTGVALYFQGKDVGSEVFLTNCVVARNEGISGGWYNGSGGTSVVSAVDLFYPSQTTPPAGGMNRLQNTILTENTICYINFEAPNKPCNYNPPLPALSYATSLKLQVDYSIFEGSVLNGTGNLDVDPLFAGSGTDLNDFMLSISSPAIDAGNPDPALEDVAFPPSQGGPQNDMGIFGGPLAGGWSLLPTTP